MIQLLITLALMVLGVLGVQVLLQVDLPRYRPLIFRIYAGLTLLGLLAIGLGAQGVAMASGTASLVLLLVGLGGAALFAQRSWYYHVLRREIDIPPHVESTFDPKIEGPAAQSAKRRAARTTGGGEETS